MQPKLQPTQAFTKLELIIVIAVIALLAGLLFPSLARKKQKSLRMTCVNNLKTIGIAYHVWGSHAPDEYPMQNPIAEGGWHDYLDQTNASRYCWTNYVILKDDLGQSPIFLTCPSDERRPALNFQNLSNTNISYFVPAEAHDRWPESFMSGDRNLSSGLTGKNNYGFSKPNGEGNDVWIKTNSTTDPICWSLKMHSDRNPAGAGNILLGDGSVQQTSSAMLRNLQTNAATATSDNADEKHKTSFRLIFP